MRTSSIYGVSLLAASLGAVGISACGASPPTAAELNQNAGTTSTVGGNSTPGAGTSSTGGASAGSSLSGGSGGSAGSSIIPMGGSAGTDPVGGSGPQAGSGPQGGGGGEAPITAYSPRSGSFKMLVYSKTAAFRHESSIVTGKEMLKAIGAEQGFEVVITETNEDITAEGLAKYEIVFFMNSTGDIFNDTEQATYENWMTTKNGAFGGVHSATDTENGWAFYSEVTGQYYNGHGAQGVSDQIQFEPAMANHPALKGLPSPWPRQEEWYKFDSYQQWSAKPGFMILGRKAADSQPIMWLREWGNFRAFYSAIGHDASVFQDPNVKKHLTGGIMWAVRREHLIK